MVGWARTWCAACMRGGHTCVVYDRSADAVKQLVGEGATGADSLDVAGRAARDAARGVGHGAGRRPDRVDRERARASCSRPATRSSTAATRSSRTTSAARKALAREEDQLRRRRHQRRRVRPRARLLPDGRRRQRGGEAPRSDLQDARARPRRRRAHAGPRQVGGTAEDGYLHCGPVGAGHFVKMVHNGIEYGIMQALAEGFDIMRGAANATVAEEHRFDAAGRRHRRGLAARQRAVVVAGRSHREGAGRGSARSRSSPAASPTPARAAGP